MSLEKYLDQGDDGVDPRVQVELERLNSATDEINRLEVDLDEARNIFRQLLQESTSRIDCCAKKLGSSIIKVRPYYDARIKAKEALQETQKAAVNFERANSAHAAAKEMVYLAEEGLKTEGRTFDHAWQEMLNHATMRVNESESERTVAEAEHKRTSQNYQIAEIRVRNLQKELKRAIAKSRPYFELKIHYTQLLEKQKLKVKNLEKQVTEVKLGYAQTLKNLERISDEIHKARQKNRKDSESGKQSESELSNGFYSPGSGVQMTRSLSEGLRRNGASETGTPNSENDSSLTGPPDTESEDEIFKYAHNQNSVKSELSPVADHGATEELSYKTTPERKAFEGVGICSFPAQTDLNLDFGETVETKNSNEVVESSDGGWTEIKLTSPDEEVFPKVKKVQTNQGKRRNELEEDFDIPYAPLPEPEKAFANASEESPTSETKSELRGGEGDGEGQGDALKKLGLEGMLCGYGSKTGAGKDSGDGEELNSRSLKGTPKKVYLRRQSLDVLWNNTAGEKMKEILSQSILKLNIGSLTEKRPMDPRGGEGNEFSENEPSINNIKGNDTAYESNLSSQFGINFFNRKNSKQDEDFIGPVGGGDERKSSQSQDSIATQLGGFMSRKDRFSFKKVPSPLEKTLNYLNADEESNSDSESLASSDMLTDEQLSSLVLDRDLAEIYQDII